MGISRTFIVRVSDEPQRVVVEDVRGRRHTLARDLGDVGAQIAAWLGEPVVLAASEPPLPPREDSVSHPT